VPPYGTSALVYTLERSLHMKPAHAEARLGLVLAAVLLLTTLVVGERRPISVTAAQRPAAASSAAQIVRMDVSRGHNMPNMSLMAPDGQPHYAILSSPFLRTTPVVGEHRSIGVTAARREAAASPAVQIVQMYVLKGHNMPDMSLMGPDGKPHDAILPSTFAVKRGIPVRLVITSYDVMPHSITASGLGLNVMIKAGKAAGNMGMGMGEMEKVIPTLTTFTFTPTKAGMFRWFCAYPCDDDSKYWAMGQGFGGPDKEGFMAGFIAVMG
jgi:hypothetical protein